MPTQFWQESKKERDYTEDLGEGCKITLKWILRIYGGGLCTGLIWLRIRPMLTSCENGTELLH